MITNAAIFTCSICGEASTEICFYCTKDTCSNHRCQRCKRCSDCCECEVPLSSEEPALIEEQVPSEPAVDLPAVESAEVPPMSPIADFLTPAEASVFAEESDPAASHVFTGSSVFVASAETPEENEENGLREDTDPEEQSKPEDPT